MRYVLAFGLAGVIIAFIALGLYFGVGTKPNDASQAAALPPHPQQAPLAGQ